MFQRTIGPLAQWATIKKYASKIEKTANGGGRSTRSQTRGAQEIQPQRRFEADGRINVRKTVARLCEDEAEEAPKEKGIAGSTIASSLQISDMAVSLCASYVNWL